MWGRFWGDFGVILGRKIDQIEVWKGREGAEAAKNEKFPKHMCFYVFLECEVHFDPANKPSRRGSNLPKIEAKLNQKIDPDFNRFLQ